MSISILVVDDEADVAELFKRKFRRELRSGEYEMHFASWTGSGRSNQISNLALEFNKIDRLGHELRRAGIQGSLPAFRITHGCAGQPGLYTRCNDQDRRSAQQQALPHIHVGEEVTGERRPHHDHTQRAADEGHREPA